MKEPNRRSAHWSLTFDRDETQKDVDLASVLAGISSLDPGAPKNNWLTLSKYSPDAELLGFAQTGVMPEGFVVEIRIEVPGSNHQGFWKAGRREPPGKVVSQSKDGRFKTFANQVLSVQDAQAICEHFYQRFQLHSGFTWTSILNDLLGDIPDGPMPFQVVACPTCRNEVQTPTDRLVFLCPRCETLLRTGELAELSEIPERRNPLVEEFRQLHQTHQDDASVREGLALMLLTTINHAKAENDLQQRDQVLEEMRQVYQTCTEDAVVSEQLARALFNTLVDAKDENNLRRRDQLLEELRQLHDGCIGSATVRGILALALFNTLVDAKEESDLRRRDQLLEELRRLHQTSKEDVTVRERLAKALFKTLVDAKVEKDLRQADRILEEVYQMNRHWPQDTYWTDLFGNE